MWWIIRDYRELFKANETLKEYCKNLEKENNIVRQARSETAQKNRLLVEKIVTLRRENKRLRAHIAWLADKVKDEYKPYILANDKHIEEDDEESL